MIVEAPSITAPACSLQEAQEVFAAGADEVYCGAMFDDWVAVFGDSDLLTRRQGRPAHVRRPDELAAIAKLARDTGRVATLTINARYSQHQESAVLELAEMWEEMGGQAVLVTDVGILVGLTERKSGLRRHLSTLAGVVNSRSAAFFADLGVSRIVIPRDLTLSEVSSLTASAPGMQYEALVMHQKCEFIDGMCGFYHGLRLPDDAPAVFDYTQHPGCSMPVVESHDPQYEGHGCQLCRRTENGTVRHLHRDDLSAPHCAACLLASLHRAGVRFFKIAGRSYPSDVIVRSIRFLREALNILASAEHDTAARQAIQRLYARTFAGPCDNTRCYYVLGGGHRSI